MYVVIVMRRDARHRTLTYRLLCLQVLQMIGRAGRPGFDTHADAVVMVRAEMKEFYKRVSAMRGSDPNRHFKEPI
jgi:replicative superfamily II helicase